MSTVVAQQHDISGNGGRKLVRLNDGALIAVTKQSPNYFLYKSVDNGNSWTRIYHNSLDSVQGVSIATDGVNIYLLITYNYNSVIYYVLDSSGAMKNGLALATETSVGECSLATNKEGTELHAAWASKNSTYPNSFNIRYAKGTINGDGSVSWGAVVQVTRATSTGTIGVTTPSISVNANNKAVIIAQVGTTEIVAYVQGNTTPNNHYLDGSSGFGSHLIYNGGAYSQSSPSAVVDKDGVIHVAWHGSASGETNNIRYSKSTDGGISWSAPVKLTNYVPSNTGAGYASLTVDRTNKLIVTYSRSGTSFDDIMQKSNSMGVWSSEQVIADSTTNHFSYPSTLHDSSFAGVFGDTPPTIYMDAQKGSVEYIGTYSTNNAPTVSLTSPNDNQTLYENSVLTIEGEAWDANNGDIVIMRYQIDSGNEINFTTAQSNGVDPINFLRTLTYKAGRLYDGENAVTSVLNKDVPHTLKVIAIDDKGNLSPAVTRLFNVVPNRNPVLTVGTFETVTNLVGMDTITVSGTVDDPDGGDVRVTCKIGNQTAIEVYKGPAGSWTHTFKVSELQDGDNQIVFTAYDNYNAAYSVTKAATKTPTDVPLATTDARYKVLQPAANMLGITAWVVHPPETSPVTASIFMGAGNVDETYVPMEGKEAILGTDRESQFTYENAEAQTNTTLRITLPGTGVMKMLSGVIK